MIQLSQITKRFPGVVANDHVDFDFAPGEIHALLGENGAGKSTLMQILYGFPRDGTPEISFIDGKRVSIESPADAIALGIGMVHQEFMLVPTFTVAENTVLGPRRGRTCPEISGKLRRAFASSVSGHHLAVDPNAITGTLAHRGPATRRDTPSCSIATPRILILDEPTAVLTAPEKDRLFTVPARSSRRRPLDRHRHP